MKAWVIHNYSDDGIKRYFSLAKSKISSGNGVWLEDINQSLCFSRKVDAEAFQEVYLRFPDVQFAQVEIT